MFKKERANGCYYTSSYYLSTMLSDLMPLRIIFPLIYGVVVYWMAGFVGDPDHFLKFILVFLLFNMVAASMFYVISIAVPSVTGKKKRAKKPQIGKNSRKHHRILISITKLGNITNKKTLLCSWKHCQRGNFIVFDAVQRSSRQQRQHASVARVAAIPFLF